MEATENSPENKKYYCSLEISLYTCKNNTRLIGTLFGFIDNEWMILYHIRV